MKLENVRIGNLLKLKEHKVYVNETMINSLINSNYELPNLEGMPIDDYYMGALISLNGLLDEEYIRKYKYVHELQNAYFLTYNEEVKI